MGPASAVHLRSDCSRGRAVPVGIEPSQHQTPGDLGESHGYQMHPDPQAQHWPSSVDEDSVLRGETSKYHQEEHRGGERDDDGRVQCGDEDVGRVRVTEELASQPDPDEGCVRRSEHRAGHYEIKAVGADEAALLGGTGQYETRCDDDGKVEESESGERGAEEPAGDHRRPSRARSSNRSTSLPVGPIERPVRRSPSISMCMNCSADSATAV